MTTLIDKIEKLIKREKTTPERKKKDDSTKSSSEILSELFGAFNADPPKIEDVSTKKAKKSKKKHKREKKKRSRSRSSSSVSDNSDTHRRKKRKKSKSKKRRDSGHSPSNSPPYSPPYSPTYSPPRSAFYRSTTPVTIKPEPNTRYTPERIDKVTVKHEKIKEEPMERKKLKVTVKNSESSDRKVDVQSKKSITSIKEECVTPTYSIEEAVSLDSINHEDVCDNDSTKKRIRRVSIKYENSPECIDITEYPDDQKRHVTIKYEDSSTQSNDVDASLIPMPQSPTDLKLDSNDLRFKLANKKNEAIIESEKLKGKIQIKNLKFSTVFEETVKKAEEEARRKAEKYEEGEYTDSSSSSVKEEYTNSQFPKSSDPGGILKQQAAEEIKISEEEKPQPKKIKQSDSTQKSSKKDSSKSHKSSSSKSRRSRSRSKSKHYSSKRKSHRRSRSRHRSGSRSRRRSGSRSRRTRHLSPRHSRIRRDRSPTGVKLADSEKKRLLEVARRNAINMLKNGAVPAGAAALPPHTRNQVMAAIQSGGKSVDELTDFCKHLSKKEALGELSSVSSNDDGMSENEDTIAFHHPFLVKEKAPIVLNIRGGAPLPIKSTPLPIANKEELRLQFPVSSGSQHRDLKSTEWVPVSPKKDNMQVAKLNSKSSAPSKPSPTESTKAAPLALPEPPPPEKSATPPYIKSFTSGSHLATVSATTLPALPAPGPQAYPPGREPAKIDVASIVSQKIAMIRKEQENENSLTTGFGWGKACSLGQFTGTTGANILTPRELASGTQAWAKKDQLQRAAPVEGGMGMHLLQKMGWTPGQGLGKEGTGTLQPLLLEVKLDTKGLQAKEEATNRHGRGMKQQRLTRRCGGTSAPLVAGGKHPVSLLGEYCSKHKLGPPEYNLCFECGPDHKKNFLFKVKVAGTEYQPAVASANKKQAKLDAAQLALQQLGIVVE